jgi:sorting nexin-1/2
MEQEFQCINPQTKSGHIVYTCRGSDANGFWEGERRFNEFYKLHAILEQRWPGVPIPILPPKKAIGNKEIKFINERRFYLERFLKKISQFPFMINSPEFQTFARPNGDIEKSLNSLARSQSWEIVEKMKECLKVEIDMYDPIMKNDLDNVCKGFQEYTRNIKGFLTSLIKDISHYMQDKNQSIQDYKIFLSMLDKYEELNLDNYVDGDLKKMVFGNTEV